MTDYFALLDQPRRPWLDLEKLKQAFHEKTLRAHPDARAKDANAAEAEAAFAQVNEAYQILQDPKRRLHHLLSLEGRPPTSAGGRVPEEIAEVFQTAAVASQEAECIAQKAVAATNPLSRSLIQGELLRARARLEQALEALLRMRRGAEAELERLSGPLAESLGELHNLYIRFSYLTRWIGQLEEKRTQLSTM